MFYIQCSHQASPDRMTEKSTSKRSANVLIKDQIAKIADFGLSRIIATGDYEQKKLSKYESKFPVRFTAPETVLDPSKQSTEGDVWSFGILIYEILSYGKRPFSEVPLEEVKNISLMQMYYDRFLDKNLYEAQKA